MPAMALSAIFSRRASEPSSEGNRAGVVTFDRITRATRDRLEGLPSLPRIRFTDEKTTALPKELVALEHLRGLELSLTRKLRRLHKNLGLAVEVVMSLPALERGEVAGHINIRKLAEHPSLKLILGPRPEPASVVARFDLKPSAAVLRRQPSSCRLLTTSGHALPTGTVQKRRSPEPVGEDAGLG